MERGHRLDDCAIILRSPDESIAIENALLEAGIGCRVEGLERYFLRPEVLMLRGVIAFALQDYASIPGVEQRLQVLQALELWQELSWSTSRIEDLKTAATQPELFDAFLHGRLLQQFSFSCLVLRPTIVSIIPPAMAAMLLLTARNSRMYALPNSKHNKPLKM